MIALGFYIIIKNENSIFYSIKNVQMIILFIFSCALSMFNTTMGKTTLCQIIMVTQLSILYYCVLYQSIENKIDIDIVKNGFLISLYLQSVLSISQYITGNPYDLFSTGGNFALENYVNSYGITRVLGTIGKPNGLAEYIVPIILLNIALYFYENKNKNMIFGGIILGCITLLLTFSRGGWTSFTIAFFILIYMLYKRNIIEMKNIIFAFILLVILIVIFYGNLERRIYGDDYNSAASRIPLIKIAINMIKEHPIIGIGANTFRDEILKYAIGPEFVGIYLYEVHNTFLLVFSETGIIGLISFLLLYIYAIKECKMCINRNSHNSIGGLSIGIYVGLISSIIHMNVDLSNSYLHIGVFFMYFAIASCISNKIIEYV